MLYKNKNEIIYRLTELYLPTNTSQRNKMIAYNKDKMLTVNDIENEPIRAKKRKVKEEIKRVKGKLKHNIKYCNPAPFMDDVYYYYEPGMTTRKLDMMKDKNKYIHAHHIARIIP